jgi:hypothetical protein
LIIKTDFYLLKFAKSTWHPSIFGKTEKNCAPTVWHQNWQILATW